MAKKHFGTSIKDESIYTAQKLDKSISEKDKQIMTAPIDSQDYKKFIKEQELASKKQKEYQVLIQKNNELEREIQKKQNSIYILGIVTILALIILSVLFFRRRRK